MHSMIHPTAIIHPRAQIGEGTSVGPGVIIDEHVEIGPQCEIRARAVLTGHARIGARNQIGYGAIIGAEPQDLSYKGATTSVEIGDDNVIREYATIHRGTKEGSVTRVGHHNFFMAGAHVAHNCEVGHHVILVNNVLLGGYVKVEDRAFIGGGAVVHQFCRIGQLAIIRGQTPITMDVPPFFMAVAINTVCGLNRVGLRRNGYTHPQRKLIQKTYDLLYYSGLNRQQAIEVLQTDAELKASPGAQAILHFIQHTKRGFCRATKAQDVGEE
ncbi:MAG: acyl-ACP--UDP-N-acetylglucosamine O-acyltransferase [bacterium]